MNNHKNNVITTTLSRDMGLTTALAIGVGTMIAAGIFTLSGLAVRNVGSAAIVAFGLAAVVALFTALTYCEFVSIYPESGEGYLYARKTFPAPLAYFVGWSLVLGYTASCAFYISSLSSYFQEFVFHSPVELLSGIIILIGLTLLNIKGTKESGGFQVVVTIGKVILLIWFVFGGIGRVDTSTIIEKFNSDLMLIGSTAGMVFITFFGFSAIAASAGEVKNPVKTIPRAIFISIGVVTVLYTLVVLVVIAAGLTEYTESAMGIAAKQFLGPIGGLVIVAGALFSMISASNASIMAGSRVMLSMSRLGHFPVGFGQINPATRTPIVSLILVGGMILIFSLSLKLEELAHFADTVLLLVLILVNVALIYHRKKFPDIKRPFRVPLVPLLPVLGIVANFYLLSQILHHLLPVITAFGMLLLGIIGYLSWKGSQPEEEELPGMPSRIAEGRFALQEKNFRVLVPLANPANVDRLTEIAGAIAKENEGQIIALRVVLVPDQLAPSAEEVQIERERAVLDLAQKKARELDVPVTSLMRIGHNAARAILETAREQDCDLILLGWKGFSSTTRRILGEVTDTVITHAKRDIMMVKLSADFPIGKYLLPTAGGSHAQRAEFYTKSLIHQLGGSLTVCSVSPQKADEELTEEINKRLDDAIERLTESNSIEVNKKIINSDSITHGIIKEAGEHDALIIGAAGDSIYRQILFGNIPETIAKSINKSVILIKHYEPVKDLLGRVMEE